MKEGLIFANARAKAKEHNLISEERVKRMMECSSVEDAIRILYEINYAGGMILETNDFYSLLHEEERLLTLFVKEVCPDEIGMECFFLKNDYHNAKVLFKEKFGKIKDIDSIFLPEGLTTINQIREAIALEKFSFNSYLDKAFQTLFNMNLKGLISPRAIDLELDKAMYKEICDRLNKSSDIHIKKYFIILIDATNILSFLRTAKIEAGYTFFENNFIEGGTLKLDLFEKLNMDVEKLGKELAGTEYIKLLDRSKNYDLSLYETSLDNYLINMFSIMKADMFSAAPIVGYYIGKLNEIKVLRVILVCLKNKVAKDEMKKRIRNIYA